MTKEILEKLKLSPIQNAWAIQDLTLWPEKTKIHWSEGAKGYSYLLISGHPAQMRHPLVILNNTGGEIELLLSYLPKSPFVIRETGADLLPIIRRHLPTAAVYHEQSMNVTRETFRPTPIQDARLLTLDDAWALAKFNGAPPQAVEIFKNWLQGAVIAAVFVDGKIVSMGTTIVRTPDVWILAGIETKPEFRGRGYAKQVTSLLTACGLEAAPVVSLTMVKDNTPAFKTYSKLGYTPYEDRIWVDHQTGSKP